MNVLEAARKGREDAFLQLFDEHHGPLFRFAYRLTQSGADAEDIVQECFLGLLRPGCSYEAGRSSLRTYLFGAVRNQALKRIGKGVYGEEARVDQRDDRSPEDYLLKAELESVVSRAIAMLPETQRETLILAYYEQMPLAEIAQVLDLELGAVKSRLQRARGSLKELLAAYVREEEPKR